MKIVFTIVIVLVYLAIMNSLIAVVINSGDFPFLAFAGIIGLTYGGFKLIQYIFKKS